MSWCAARQAVTNAKSFMRYREAGRSTTTTFYRWRNRLLFLLVVAAVLLTAGCGRGGKASQSCDELKCEEPAVCDDTQGETICVCPEGYLDVNEDSSECRDIDECSEGLDDCADNAFCTNTEGSYECACLPPAYTGDGKTCECATGYLEISGKCQANDDTACSTGYIEVLGKCKAEDGTSCEQDTDCFNGHCVAGICCKTDCDTPSECRTDQGATCTNGLTCLYPNSADGSSCDDGDPCTTDDACRAGECKGGEPLDCDDDNPCTDDSCDPDFGCKYKYNDNACDDDDACTTNDSCDDGECKGGEPPDCDDSNVCTDDSCDSDGGCVHVDNSAACDDNNVCTTDSCHPKNGCKNENNTLECEDGNACTTGDTCVDGECVSGSPLTCNDEEFCTDDSCDPETGCVFTNKTDDTPCDDDDQCTPPPAEEASGEVGGSSCEDGQCVARKLTDCNDNNPCTDDSCDPAIGCVYTNNAAECEEGNACTVNDHCVEGECVSGDDRICDDGNVCTNDGCNPSTGCTVVNNTAACDDDNPCTVNDHCLGGLCQDTDPLNCDDDNMCTDNLCDPTEADANPCYFPNNSAPCDDDDPCTETDVCSAGTCTGSGNPCGPNATGCTPDTPYTCICPEPEYVAFQGQCVFNTNECLLEPFPCDQNASCSDPSSALDDAQCTCNVGYTGDGYNSTYQPEATGCAVIDECADDPCGVSDGSDRASSCTQSEPGMYTCSCNPGYMQVDSGSGPTCVCDLNGTFALRLETHLSWEDIQYIQDGSGTNYSWAILNQNYLSDGTLQTETIGCGGTSADLCGTGFSFFGIEIPPQAYAQFTPAEIYTLPPILPSEISEMSLPLPLAGSPYLTPLTATLLGIHLDDPFGPWPASRRNVSEGPTAPGGGYQWTNHAMWIDHDEDGNFGVTNYAVPAGGAGTLTVSTDPLVTATPPFEYDALSPVCTSDDDPLPYNWYPSRYSEWVKRFHTAARLIRRYSGTIQSCDLIDGAVIGPNTGDNEGQFLAQVRVHSCVRCEDWYTGSDCPDRACEGYIVDEFDAVSQDDQTIDSSNFVIQRIPSDYTCENVRAMSFSQ